MGKKKFTTEEFIKKASKIHGSKYDYTHAVYSGSEIKTKIYCKECKRFFFQTPYAQLHGRGCVSCGRKRTSKLQMKDLSEKKFGRLTALYLLGTGDSKWHCKCDCGNEVNIRATNLQSGTTRSCGCISKTIGPMNPNFKGYEEISLGYWNGLINGARSRNIYFNISIEYAWNLYAKQHKKCALSGRDINFCIGRLKKGDASLDRIDSSKGYVKGNVQWVHKVLNKMKMNMPNDAFIDWCRLVSKNLKKEDILK
jgi:hypothetical protein